MTFRPSIAATISMAVILAPLWLLYRSGDAGLAPVAAVFSCAAFTERPIVTGGALDQPSLHKELFVLGFSILVLCPSVAFVRWITGPSPRIIRRLFATVSLIMLVHPLSILTIFTWDVSRYVYRMGVTPMRLAGLAASLTGYVTLAVFAVWVAGIKMRRLGKGVVCMPLSHGIHPGQRSS